MDNKFQINIQDQVRKKRRKGLFRGFFVVSATLAITSFSVTATDTFTGVSNLLGSAVLSTESSQCPEGMVLVADKDGSFCIDAFEASPNVHCVHQNVSNQSHTRENIQNRQCASESKGQAQPWTFVARHQAEEICARSGKRLPTNKEWYKASLGTPDVMQTKSRSECNIQSSRSAAVTGEQHNCVSSVGAYDMVGNVWEWVDANVEYGSVKTMTLPSEGYVSSVNTHGIPIQTSSSSDPNFNNDYFWINKEQVTGMIRGGYYGNGNDAGVYAINAETPPSFASVGVGFRCVK